METVHKSITTCETEVLCDREAVSPYKVRGDVRQVKGMTFSHKPNKGRIYPWGTINEVISIYGG